MHPRKFFLSPKNQVEDLTGSSCTSHQQSCLPDPIYVSSSSSDDENDLPNDDDASKQLVLYDPASNENNKIELAPGPLPLQCEPPPLLDLLPRSKPSRSVPKVLPSVGAFTVQCASCFKWRLIPTKEKYEEIREHILEQPFVCQRALEWRPDVSCDDPEDISQDGNRIWAIDKPSIAQPPDGWQRLLRIRSEGSSKFADVYYVAPTGKRLRSMVDIQKFLTNHPEYLKDGVTLSRFSFTIPKPLQENYVRKRPATLKSSYDLSGPVQPEQARPLSIAWPGPEDSANSDEDRSGIPAPFFGSDVFDPISRPTKKRTVQKQSSFQNDAL